ncbi:MAG: glycerate kinase [Prevotella sp.]
MKYLLAIDSFKGCLSSIEVEAVMADALRKKGADVISIPMSDGGEGMLETFTTALKGSIVDITVHDPMMRMIQAQYGISTDGETAIIETSKACGLTLMTEEERNPLIATSYGVGELIGHAIKSGCHKFIIGLGGSGTSDCGIGMLRSLIDIFAKGKTFEYVMPSLKECQFKLASDVRNVLCGDEGAAFTFGRQKGATDTMLYVLEARAKMFADISARHFGYDKSAVPGAGAAGGLGYAFMQYLGAESSSGADILLDLSGFNEIVSDVDIVITGEGHADRQTLMGKLPERVLKRSMQYHIPVWLLAGKVSDSLSLYGEGFARIDAITPSEMSINEAIIPENARQNIITWINKNINC